MGKEVLAAGVIGIEKHKFQFYKSKMQILKKELVSSKISSGEKNYKYFIVTCMMIMMVKLNVFVE